MESGEPFAPMVLTFMMLMSHVVNWATWELPGSALFLNLGKNKGGLLLILTYYDDIDVAMYLILTYFLRFFPGSLEQPIYLDGIRCTQSDSRLIACRRDRPVGFIDGHHCRQQHAVDIGLICVPHTIPTPTPGQGNVLYLIDDG